MATCNAIRATESSLITAPLRVRGTLTLPGTAGICGGRYGEEAPKEPGDVTTAGGQLKSASTVVLNGRWSVHFPLEILAALRLFPVGLLTAVAAPNA